jgi:hypothetical protein
MAKDNRDGEDKPNFNINFYAVNKKGEYAGAAIWNEPKEGRRSPSRFAVANASGARVLESAYLFKRGPRKTPTPTAPRTPRPSG